MKTTIPLYLIAIGIACIGLQNAGIIRPYKLPEITINGPVEVENRRFSQGRIQTVSEYLEEESFSLVGCMI